MIRKSFIGKICSKDQTSYKINLDEFDQLLTIKGIRAILGGKNDPKINAGLNWNITSFLRNPSFTPQENTVYENQDGSMSLRFHNYGNTGISSGTNSIISEQE